MNSSLAAFQEDFAKALFAPADVVDPRVRQLTVQPAFAVYRNTVMKACIDALEANFPAVARLVGTEWFRAAAAVHVATEPPSDGRLLHYGDSFADFLKHFEPAAELGYLPDVARLDVFWRQAHAAPDASPIHPSAIARCTQEQLVRLHVAPHPAARWAWFSDSPAYTIWSRNRQDGPVDDSEIVWRGEGALLTRPHDAVAWQYASRADCAFMDACAAGLALPDAAERALVADPEADLSAVLAGLLRAGALMGDDTPPTDAESAP
ncbi:MAG: DNA-binding domain-containing protein [Gammaproteobacteria bacterium]|nr:DNA-binding domain-containing protein [Gammaproteobacteria bacterium]